MRTRARLSSTLLITLLIVSLPISANAQMPTGILGGDILISRAEGKSAVADDMNFWKPANPYLAYGTLEPLWFLNVTSAQFCWVVKVINRNPIFEAYG